jgi:hypothetical protein
MAAERPIIHSLLGLCLRRLTVHAQEAALLAGGRENITMQRRDPACKRVIVEISLCAKIVHL